MKLKKAEKLVIHILLFYVILASILGLYWCWYDFHYRPWEERNYAIKKLMSH